ncbi:hypothetical protein QAD02_022332 [Eretmocerus hayati]|uniref:Uncharacterized protein n=1 Tax=Eretmocerus hayati TaxID=131215 RepID=A0ACC2PTU4_9HYME|nr:hypothetical protein QAD02_022332 [Eretmocerus hayati]
MLDQIDSQSAKKVTSELPISQKFTQLASIDVNDTLFNQFLNESKEYREAIGIVSHPQRTAQISTDPNSIENEINKTLDSHYLDAKFRGPNCPQPCKPIRRDLGRSIFGTWRDRKCNTPALPSISEELSSEIEPIQLNPARQNITKASKFDFPPRFSDKADSEDKQIGTKHTKSAGAKAIGSTSTHSNEHYLSDPTVPHHDLSSIGEQNQPQLLTKTISHLSGNQNLKEKRATEYFEGQENVKGLTDLLKERYNKREYNYYDVFEFAARDSGSLIRTCTFRRKRSSRPRVCFGRRKQNSSRGTP